MGDYRDKLAKKATDVLAPGEQLLAGARLVRNVLAIATGAAIGGAIGAAVVARSGGEDGPEGTLAGDLRLPKQVAIGLTDRRLIFWRRSVWTGGATEVLGELAHTQVASIGYASAGYMGKLEITLVDGSVMRFQAPRMEKGSAQRIGEEWTQLHGAASAAAA